MSFIQVRQVTTIFGPRPRSILPRVVAGEDKAALRAETGHTVALADVSLDIEAGQLFVVMGLSGSGKSTLVRHINRLIDPTAGSIVIGGANLLGLSLRALTRFRRRPMGMVFQRFGLLPHRTVLDNAAYGLEPQGRAGQKRRWSADD